MNSGLFHWNGMVEWNTGMTLNPCENAALIVYDGSEGLCMW